MDTAGGKAAAGSKVAVKGKRAEKTGARKKCEEAPVLQIQNMKRRRIDDQKLKVSDKDLCLLKERTKRVVMTRPVRPTGGIAKAQQPSSSQQQMTTGPFGLDYKFLEQLERESMNVSPPKLQNFDFEMAKILESPVNIPKTAFCGLRNIVPKPRPVSGPFGLDPKFLEQLERDSMNVSPPKLQNFDLAEIWGSPVNIPKTAFCGLRTRRDDVQPTALITSQSTRLDDCTTTSQIVDSGIGNVASADVQLSWQANIQMVERLNTDKACELIETEDSLINSCCTQLKLMHDNFDQGGIHSLDKGYETLLLLIFEFFDQKALCSNVSEDSLTELMENLLMILVSGRVNNLEHGSLHIRGVHALVLCIIERANHTNVTCAFLRILHKCSGSSTVLPRFEELTLKCLWRLIKLFPDWEGDLDIPRILMKIHHFLKDYPSQSWKKRESDRPICTIKIIMHALTEMVGGEKILQQASRIDNLGDSEMRQYLNKLVKKIESEESKAKPKKPSHR